MRARAWLVVPVAVLVYAGGVVASGPAIAAPTCFGASATIAGTPGADILRGTPGADVIIGGGGNDTIRGLGGDDRICGGAGADVLAGGSGGDWIDGGALEDSIRGGPSGDIRFTRSGIVGNDNLFGGPGDDTLWSGRGQVDFLYGETGNDTLTGAPNEQLLAGGPGNDVLSGSSGQDELWGGAGADHLGGATGRFDLVLYFTDGPRLSVNLATQHADGDGRDSLSGVEAVFALGNSDDHLIGDGRRNFFLSGDGNDQVQARGGSDLVETSGGADAVSAGTGSDGVFIKDHVQGNDAANGGPGKDFCIRDAHDALRSCVSGPPQPVPVAVREALMVANAARAEQRA
ncbi:MAG TPA: calcium-binding protein [Actinomycetota bacterium]